MILEKYKNSSLVEKDNIIGLRYEYNKHIINFRTGIPNLSLFPNKIWADLYKKVCQDLPSIHLDYHEPRGCYDLRYELAVYLKRVRGVNCNPNQVFITTGAAQAFTILGRLFNDKKKIVLVEDPLSNGILDCLERTDLKLHPIPVDKKGMNTNLLPNDINPSLIFTTPSHQFPMGGVLPIKRRIDLIKYSRRTLSYIIEDDYDSEFRFKGAPIESLQRLDPDRVVYIGTFSKILCPALRIGYMIVPEQLINHIKKIKYAEDIHSPVLEQLTLARFISEGYLDKHIRKSKKHYHNKNQLLIKELYKKFGDSIIITGDTTGIHLLVSFKNRIFDEEFFVRCMDNGLWISTVEEHAIKKGNHRNKLLIGYGNLTDDEIVGGINILYSIITNNTN